MESHGCLGMLTSIFVRIQTDQRDGERLCEDLKDLEGHRYRERVFCFRKTKGQPFFAGGPSMSVIR